MHKYDKGEKESSLCLEVRTQSTLTTLFMSAYAIYYEASQFVCLGLGLELKLSLETNNNWKIF